MKKSNKQLKLPSFFDLIKQSLVTLKENLKLFLKLIGAAILAFVMLVLVFAVIFLILILPSADFKSLLDFFINNNNLPNLSETLSLLIIIIIILFAIFSYLIQIWIQAALVSLVKAIIDKDKKISIKNIILKSKRFVLPLFIINLILTFLIIGGYALFLVPGVLFSIWFGFTTFVMVDENKFGFRAILTSADYVKGNTIKVFTRWLLFGALSWVIGGLAPIIFEKIGMDLLGFIYSILFTLFIGPLSIIFGFIFFRKLKEQKPEFKHDFSKSRILKYIGISSFGYLLFVAIILILSSF